MNNTRIWDEVCMVPAGAQKKINGGRLKGMTDISPIWRYRKMTELFGACGIGWRYKIVNMWTQQSGEQVSCFVQIDLQYKEGEIWSDPVPGIGGSMLVAKEKAGYHFSDEAYKMALTDSLGTAMKMIGVAADVYAGQTDSKYAVPGEDPTYAFAVQLASLAKTKGFSKVDYFEWLEQNNVDVKSIVSVKSALEKMAHENNKGVE
jgi:hypothetical protein